MTPTVARPPASFVAPAGSPAASPAASPTGATPLLLFPGAGTDSEHPSLRAIEAAVRPRRCVRADFPYRLAGRRVPDRAPVLVDAVVAAAHETARRSGIVLGGRSMGGRMCSLAVADGLVRVAGGVRGLVLVAYPLHPPKRPDRLRVEHFPRLAVPCLFVSGTRDGFGSPEELEHWTSTIPGPVTHRWIPGAGHELKGADEVVAVVVAEWIRSLGSG